MSSAVEFRVHAMVTDLSGGAQTKLKDTESDVLIIDPSIFDYVSRLGVRQFVPDSSEVAVVALSTVAMNDEEQKQYDGIISLYDAPAVIIKKLREAITPLQQKPKQDGEELSSREKEILVCVAKGMLNKEIADYYNISIYTVITHRKNITRKTGIKSVAGLTVYAILNHLIDTDIIE